MADVAVNISKAFAYSINTILSLILRGGYSVFESPQGFTCFLEALEVVPIDFQPDARPMTLDEVLVLVLSRATKAEFDEALFLLRKSSVTVKFKHHLVQEFFRRGHYDSLQVFLQELQFCPESLLHEIYICNLLQRPLHMLTNLFPLKLLIDRHPNARLKSRFVSHVNQFYPDQWIYMEVHALVHHGGGHANLKNQSLPNLLGHATRNPHEASLVAAHMLHRGEHLMLRRMGFQHVKGFNADMAQLQCEERKLSCMQLPSHVSVHFIDNLRSLHEARLHFVENERIGIDVEWFPKGYPKAEVVQLAQANHVFVFDFGQYSPLMSSFQVRNEVNQILSNWMDNVSQVLLFGSGDMRVVQNRHRQFTFLNSISPLCHELNHKLGLSHLVMSKLGKPLEKDLQQSNWRVRPLSADQIAYAALDAWIMLEL